MCKIRKWWFGMVYVLPLLMRSSLWQEQQHIWWLHLEVMLVFLAAKSWWILFSLQRIFSHFPDGLRQQTKNILLWKRTRNVKKSSTACRFAAKHSRSELFLVSSFPLGYLRFLNSLTFFIPLQSLSLFSSPPIIYFPPRSFGLQVALKFSLSAFPSHSYLLSQLVNEHRVTLV